MNDVKTREQLWTIADGAINTQQRTGQLSPTRLRFSWLNLQHHANHMDASYLPGPLFWSMTATAWETDRWECFVAGYPAFYKILGNDQPGT